MSTKWPKTASYLRTCSNDVELLQLEIFENEISTSKIYHTKFILT